MYNGKGQRVLHDESRIRETVKKNVFFWNTTGLSGQDTVQAGTFWRKTMKKPTWNHEKP